MSKGAEKQKRWRVLNSMVLVNYEQMTEVDWDEVRRKAKALAELNRDYDLEDEDEK